jgi:hypothetical protein
LAKSFRERKKLVENFVSDEVVIEPDPFMREKMEKAIRVMARDIEVIDLLKNFLARARFLSDNCNGSVGSLAARNSTNKILAVFLSAG